MSIETSQRIVIKIGSALIAPEQDGCRSRYLLNIAQFIVQCRAKGKEVLLVSSGAVAAGSHLFKNKDKSSVAVKKAMAAAGQTEMISTWERFFDFPSAQLLLTHGDLRDRDRYNSIRETLFTLLEQGILPIINENDAVTTDDLKVGDNDNLSAMVAAAADADCLIICSDVNGLYDKDPNKNTDARLLDTVGELTPEIYAMTGGPTSSVGTGGMRTKLQAAEKATSHGIVTYIVNGFNEDTFSELLNGANPGTRFLPYDTPMQEAVHWMTHTASEQGELIVEANEFDELSCDDIVAVNGDFSAGETVLVRNEDGQKLAKANSNYSSCLLNFIAQQDKDIVTEKVQDSIGPVISQNDIAVFEERNS
ncbi:glutamate 5-kinase [Pseudoalteromonas rubra]|uniref:Glutamate 5-kinase n=1 Tax=Pseudoalteromonas rubra TaxID=43658 RepID=A0A5S3WZZ4_9GAMM|nr:glutamate 5-kinase [Pseudoalteromonas rubra]TMP37488.1 glutamate 5-kinase [Pseudoalteromonas rubra]